MINKVKEHWLAMVISIIVGFLFLFPQLFYQISLGRDFKGIFRVINDDEPYYMSRAQESVDGYIFLTNPFLFEHKDGQPMQFFLPDLISVLPARAFDINVYYLYQIYDFLLPAIIFILAYLIFYEISKDNFYSILFSFWFLGVKYFLWFNRPISPQFVFIFVLLFWLALLRILKNNSRSSKSIVFAGVIMGLLFNFYTYFWTYCLTIIGLSVIYFIYRHDWKMVRRFLIMIGIGLFIGLPYFYQLWSAGKLACFNESIDRLGMLSTRIPSGLSIVFAATLVSFLFLWRWITQRKNNYNIKPSEVVIFIAVISAILNVNHHIITGKNLLFSSHYEIISYFFALVGVFYLVFSSKSLRAILDFATTKIIMIVMILFCFYPNLERSIDFNFQKELNRQEMAKIFSWINNNVEKDSVILSNSQLSGLIPSYTSANVFYDGDALLFFMADDEVLERFVLNNYWQENFDGNFVKDNFESVYGFKYDVKAGREKQLNKLRRLLGRPAVDLESVYYPAEQINNVLNYYSLLTEEEWREKMLSYRLDYVILDKQNDINFVDNIDKLKDNLSDEPIEVGDYLIFKL